MTATDVVTVGFADEIAAIERFIVAGRPGLVVVLVEPHSRRLPLVREIRAQALRHRCGVVPADAMGDDLGLVVEPASTVDEFRAAIKVPAPAGDDPDVDPSRALFVVLVTGFRPEASFDRWFRKRFAPRLATRKRRRIVVVIADATDAADLQELADLWLPLRSPPRPSVVAVLQGLEGTPADQLTALEVDAYADAVVDRPDLLDAFLDVLPLTMSRGMPASHGG